MVAHFSGGLFWGFFVWGMGWGGDWLRQRCTGIAGCRFLTVRVRIGCHPVDLAAGLGEKSSGLSRAHEAMDTNPVNLILSAQSPDRKYLLIERNP